MQIPICFLAFQKWNKGNSRSETAQAVCMLLDSLPVWLRSLHFTEIVSFVAHEIRSSHQDRVILDPTMKTLFKAGQFRKTRSCFQRSL